MPPLTYLEFLAAFVAGPVAVLLAVGPGIDRGRRRTAVAGVAVMLFLALSYTTPWDNYLIAVGTWTYGEGTVLFRVWNAPIEEYAFVALQTLLASLWLYRRPLPLPALPGAASEGDADGVGARRAGTGTDAAPGGGDPAHPGPDGARADGGLDHSGTDATGIAPGVDDARTDADPATGGQGIRGVLLGGGAGLAVTVAGALALSGPTYYLGAILAWGGPVLGLQWAVGGTYLLSVRRHVLWAVGPPVVYLCAIDRLAIGWGLWTIEPVRSTGLTVAGLPVEEATFFLVTTLMVVQGLVLFHWVFETRPYRSER
ncbi:hypothetical protein BRD00_08765 [Halobacteriales archaeon QS_8_69_26]|nr:MAG: hypothetical protein BRD00_08765 [Halobacteriales archaeon QS_8_69_26]